MKNWRSRKIVKGVAMNGIVSEGQLLTQGMPIRASLSRPSQMTVR